MTEAPIYFENVAPSADALRVAGITPFTTIDFPGKLSAVVFIQGCPWRCIYCHNPWMQPRDFDPELAHSSWEELSTLLLRRKGLLDGVVFSGGEPCTDPALPAAVKAVKDMGFAVGLHTGGAYPHRLEEILPLLDWVGLDVKASPEDDESFNRIVGKPRAVENFRRSFEFLKASGVPFECRTTAHPDYLPNEALLRLAYWLETEKIETFALQIYRKPIGCMVNLLPSVGSDYPGEDALAALKRAVPRFIERRNDR